MREEGDTAGSEVWGGHSPLVWGSKWSDGKNKGRECASAIDVHHLNNVNNNQLIVGVVIWGCVGEEATLGWNVWGGRLLVIWGDKLIDEKIERWADLGLRWPPFDE